MAAPTCCLQSRREPISEAHARFYAAAVVQGLAYMEQRNLIWRWAPLAA